MNSAVLIIGFNRPERLTALINRLRDAAPPRVYLAIDGPRNNSDAPRVLAAQNTVAAIDWTDQVFTRFRTTNLGCQHGVIDAVTWFLDAEPEGIIVEDDAVPDLSFFPFCDELLERYRGNERVLAIAGESRVPRTITPTEDAYRFSYMGPAGAWATWTAQWHSFLRNRTDNSPLATFAALAHTDHSNLLRRTHWSALMLANKTRVMDSWAYPFMLYGIANHRLTATPNTNLVADHGIGEDARHMRDGDPLAQPAGSLTWPLSHPPRIAVDTASEQWSNDHEAGAAPRQLAKNALTFVRRSLRR